MNSRTVTHLKQFARTIARLALPASLLVLPLTTAAQSNLPIHWDYSPIVWPSCVAYSPNGKLLAVGGAGGVQIFSAPSGGLVRCLPTAANEANQNSNGPGVCSLAFSPDGTKLAVGGTHFAGTGSNPPETGVVELWSVSTGNLINSLNTAANHGALSVVFSPNGAILADGGQFDDDTNPNNSYGIIELWNLSTGAAIKSLSTATAAGGSVNSLAFSPDGSMLISGGEHFANGGGGGSGSQTGTGGVLELWAVTSGELKATLNTSASSSINSVAFSPSGASIADGGEGWDSNTNTATGVLELWSATSGKLIADLGTSANDGVGAVAFSPDGSSLADGGGAGSGAGVLEEWSALTGAFLTSFNTANPIVDSVAFSPDGSTLADGGHSNGGDGSFLSGAAELWNVSGGVLNLTLNTLANNGVYEVAISPDGNTLAYGGIANASPGGEANGIVQLWDIPSGTLRSTFTIPTGSAFMPPTSIAFSPDSNTLAVGCVTGNASPVGLLQLWSVSSGTLIGRLNTAITQGVTSVAFSPDGTLLADVGEGYLSGKFSGVVELWNVSSRTLLTSLPTTSQMLQSVAFSPDGTLLADGGVGVVGAADVGVLELWNLSTDKLVKSFSTLASSGVNSVCFSPDNKTLVDGGYSYNYTSGSSEAVLELWNVSTEQKLQAPSLASGTTDVLSTAISPDGQVLFVGTNTNLQAFSVANRALLGYFNVVYPLGFPGGFTSVTLSPNDSLLAYGSNNGSAVLSSNPYYSPVAISSVSISPEAVLGGTGATGTVTLAQAAPAAGDSVTLASGNNSVGVPGFVTVPAGATQATFPITTKTLANSATAVITATSGGASATASLNISNLSVVGLNLNPASVEGGSSSTATITLSGPAPAGGVTTIVSSNSRIASVPSTATVAGGSTQGTFTISTDVVNSEATASISAGSGTAATYATLTITPAAIASITLNPPSVVQGDSVTGTISLTGSTGSTGAVVSPSTSNSAVTLPGSVTIPPGQSSATFTVNTAGASPQSVTITATLNGQSKTAQLTITAATIGSVRLNPSNVPGGTTSTGTVTLTGTVGSPGFLVTLASNSKDATVPKSVTVQPGQTTVSFTVKTSSVSAQTEATITASNAATKKTAVLTITPPTIVSVGVTPSTVAGGASSGGMVTLSAPAAAGGQVIKLTSSTTYAKVSASVTVLMGKSTATFTVKTVAVPAQELATITAASGGTSMSAALAITSPALVSLKLNPASVKGGRSSTGTVAISSAAPAGGLRITLSSSLVSATVPTSVVIAAGSSSAIFTVKTKAVTSSTSTTVKATLGSTSKTAVLTIS